MICIEAYLFEELEEMVHLFDISRLRCHGSLSIGKPCTDWWIYKYYAGYLLLHHLSSNSSQCYLKKRKQKPIFLNSKIVLSSLLKLAWKKKEYTFVQENGFKTKVGRLPLYCSTLYLSGPTINIHPISYSVNSWLTDFNFCKRHLELKRWVGGCTYFIDKARPGRATRTTGEPEQQRIFFRIPLRLDEVVEKLHFLRLTHADIPSFKMKWKTSMETRKRLNRWQRNCKLWATL